MTGTEDEDGLATSAAETPSERARRSDRRERLEEEDDEDDEDESTDDAELVRICTRTKRAKMMA